MKITYENNALKVGGFEFGILSENERWSSDRVAYYDGIIIDGVNDEFVREIVARIRRHHRAEVYLKPVFLLKNVTIKDPVVNELIDGVVFSLEQVELLLDRTKDISMKSKEVLEVKSMSFEAEVINKTFNLLVTRDKKRLEAYPYNRSGIGYYYPEMSVNFPREDEHNVLSILKMAEDDGLLTSSFNDRVYLCTSCSGAYLNYREVCPQCSSSHSTTEDMVHHFPCAYIGPIKDFQNTIDDELNCPKCNKTLRHIGVDYDKPSVLHTCQKCNHKYQDYHVKAKCISCHHDNHIENLISKEIKNYTLTRKGRSIAFNGYVSTTRDFDDVPGTVKYDVFKIMLKYEIERLRQNDYTSNIGFMHLANAGEIYSRLGLERQKSLITEMIGILRHNLRSADFIAFYDASTLVLSLNEIPTKIANKILNDIADLTVSLMKRNFKTVEVHIKTNAIKLNTATSHELQLQNLMKTIDRTPSNVEKDSE
ncbi:TackOD1 domain-containing metal-binding protein [Parvicella tangerina]|uniref:Thaumarchaeal output domain-containing protein n=1 Tax=Parvicella tangerina TaxID=2829795 RepID=A0A916JNM4_9FLAO|nr:hypothetical protein [Parvicella tangerina]CAG5084166.1 hypothetical protein CRYO30217_02395 [Parvicella tangerina]